LESINETLADRTRRLQRIEQRGFHERGLHASGAQSAPTQLTVSKSNLISSSSTSNTSRNVALPALVSQDDEKIIITKSQPPIDPIVAAAKALVAVKSSRKESKDQPEKQWIQQRHQKQENQRRLEQKQQEERGGKLSQSTHKGTSITDLITRRIARPLPPSSSSIPIVTDISQIGIGVKDENDVIEREEEKRKHDFELEDEEDFLRRQQLAAANEKILSEVKRNLAIVKNSAVSSSSMNFNNPSTQVDLIINSPRPTTNSISVATIVPQPPILVNQSQPTLSDAAQQVANQMKKMGNHFSLAQKLSEQYKSTANEYGGLPFLE